VAAIHFQHDRYSIELLEDLALNTLILTVTAQHEKQLPIYYSMVAPEDARSANIFALDTVSGEIRLAKALDRETLDRHLLKVTAYLRQDPSISARTTVTISVLDVQDCSPVFERNLYFAEIREDAPVSVNISWTNLDAYIQIGTTVLSVFARDLDAGDNGQVDYSIGEGDGTHLLRIQQETGVVQTAAELDRESLALIRLTVMATDRGKPPRSGSAHVEVGSKR
jgi:hypothetical protein